MYPTAHIELADKSKIAKTVIMPGDPLRAKFIAENFLTDTIEINSVRGMLAYTGLYNNKKVSVFGSGMGMPSMGIYSYELYKFYDVDNIIRIGSAGSYTSKLNMYDVVLATSVWSDSSYAKVQSGLEDDTLSGSDFLNSKLENNANKLNIPLKKGKLHSTDVFYNMNKSEFKDVFNKHGCEVVEMEAFALFANAKLTNKNAACLLTVSDSFITNQHATAAEREKSFTNMMKIALEIS